MSTTEFDHTIGRPRVCPRCRYELDGLPCPHRCPECGLAYDELTEVWSYQPMNVKAWAATVILIALGAMTVMFIVDKSSNLRNKMRGFLHKWQDWVFFIFAAAVLLSAIRSRIFAITPDGILLAGVRRRKQMIPWEKVIGLGEVRNAARQGWFLITRRIPKHKGCKARYISVEGPLHAQVPLDEVRESIRQNKKNQRAQFRVKALSNS